MDKITIGRLEKAPVINRNIYGHFAEHLGHCIYEGIFVGKDSEIPNVNGIRSDVVEAMKRLHLPVIRMTVLSSLILQRLRSLTTTQLLSQSSTSRN